MIASSPRGAPRNDGSIDTHDTFLQARFSEPARAFAPTNRMVWGASSGGSNAKINRHRHRGIRRGRGFDLDIGNSGANARYHAFRRG